MRDRRNNMEATLTDLDNMFQGTALFSIFMEAQEDYKRDHDISKKAEREIKKQRNEEYER